MFQGPIYVKVVESGNITIIGHFSIHLEETFNIFTLLHSKGTINKMKAELPNEEKYLQIIHLIKG